jgi:hypothetical protein
MRESCSQKGLAERAFFRYSRGGSQITGPSVHLARELARCFGNVQYGIAELRRDDEHGESEMQAFAWDVQTNTRATDDVHRQARPRHQEGPEGAHRPARHLREQRQQRRPPAA